MPVHHCTACGATGHRSDSRGCPKRGQSTTCGYCSRKDGTHTEGCKRKGLSGKPRGRPVSKPTPTGGGTRSKPPRKKAAPAVPAEPTTDGRPLNQVVGEAKALLAEKLREQLADLRAETRAIERLLASVGISVPA